LLKMIIGHAYRLSARMIPPEPDLLLEVDVWEYALGDIPTQHLEECFKRAVRAHKGGYMVTAPEIREQYEEYKPELLRNQNAREQRMLTGGSDIEVCRRCKGAGWLVDRLVRNHPQLEMCPECGGKVVQPERNNKAPRMSLSQWRDMHLAVCQGCSDTRFTLAHKKELAAFAGIPWTEPEPPSASEFMQPVEEDEDDILF
jgi:hypothetical protein